MHKLGYKKVFLLNSKNHNRFHLLLLSYLLLLLTTKIHKLKTVPHRRVAL